MTVRHNTPTYNLKAVVMETGLKPVTLRAWERRYGLPQPERTAGGHRIYSQRDIGTIKWLASRQDEGVSISQAVALWHSLTEAGQDPLAETEPALEAPLAIPAGTVQEQLSTLRAAWLKAAMAFDEAALEQIMMHAFSLFPPDTVCLDLLQASLVEIGWGWARGEVTIQQEHFASAYAMRRLEMLLAGVAPPIRPELILVGCAPEEDHTFGPRLLTYLLRRHGWGVVYLGANVPDDQLSETIELVEPELVILSAQRLATAANLQKLVQSLQSESVLVAYGGAVFAHNPSIQTRIEAHYLGSDLRAVPQTVHNLFQQNDPPALPAPAPLSETYRAALAQYQERRGLLETHLWDAANGTESLSVQLSKLNQQVERAVIAALKLGDIGLLGHTLESWSYLGLSYALTDADLRRYFAAYLASAERHLDEAGQIITDWLVALNSEADGVGA